jgi:uncharacterized protein involved in exopolysaccharide biosynthesis
MAVEPESRTISSNAPVAVSDKDDSGFLGFLLQLAHRKKLIAVVTGASTAIGIACAFLLPVRYLATTRIMTPQQTQSSAAMLMNQLANSGANALATMAAGSGLSIRNPNDLYIGLLRSRPIADSIIQQFGLQALYHARDMTVAREKLATNTAVESEKSGFLAVSVTDDDKQRAAAIANAYTEQLRILTKTLAVSEASRRRLFYEDQLKRSKDDLLAAKLNVQKIGRQKGVVELDAQSRGLINGLTQLRAMAAAKQVELKTLKSYSTEQNPEVQLTQTQLESLEAEIARLEQSNHTASPSGLGLQDLAGAGMDYLSAAHELQYRQTLFDLLVRQYDAARLDEAKEAAVIQIIETAKPPDQRASPHRASIAITFALLGFLAACSYQFVVNFLRANPDVSEWLIQFKSAIFQK